MSTGYSSTPVGMGTASPQPMQIVYINHPGQPHPPQHVEYKAHDLSSVKWISGLQMLFAIMCIILQAVTLGITDSWLAHKRQFKSIFDDFSIYLDTPDEAGTGIWSGVLMVITAAIGIASTRHTRKGLIVTYVVLSAVTLPFTLALIGTGAAAVAELNNCRRFGHSINIYISNSSYYGYNYLLDKTTNTQAPNHFLGETINWSSGLYTSSDFHCNHPMFTFWLVFNGLLITSSAAMFILCLMSLVYSSKAACGRCCRQCCCMSSPPNDYALVSYQPTHQIPMQTAQMPHNQPVMYRVPANTGQPPVMYTMTAQPATAEVLCPPYNPSPAVQNAATSTSPPAAPSTDAVTQMEKEAPPPLYTPHL